nr:ATP synthase F0 subunit 8 [Aneides aeneus]
MPQLNPGPWFTIFTMSWLIYMILMMKIMNQKPLNEPMMLNINKKTESWNWPWT